jgi:microcystin degradation protein MlrC
LAARGAPAAAEGGRGLTILSDTGDSTYGGAPGDSTCVVRALLEAQAAAVAEGSLPPTPGLL